MFQYIEFKQKINKNSVLRLSNYEEILLLQATLRARFTNRQYPLLIIYILLQTICPSSLSLIFGPVF